MMFLLLLACAMGATGDVPNPPFFGNPIAQGVRGAVQSAAADLDADGDLDVVATILDDDSVVWFENLGGVPRRFVRRTLADGVDRPASLAVADLNGDHSLDVVVATRSGTILWFESSALLPPTFTMHTLTPSEPGVDLVVAHDVDGDQDEDVLASSFTDDTVMWFENDGLSPPGFTRHLIAGPALSQKADGPTALDPIDLDSDSHVDILVSSSFDSTVAWYQSNGQSPPSFTRREIAGFGSGSAAPVLGAQGVVGVDLDDDTNVDVAVAAGFSGQITWFRNLGGTPPTFQAASTSLACPGIRTIRAADLDGDTFPDLIAACSSTNAIRWYRNSGGPVPTFTSEFVAAELNRPQSAVPVDIDADDDIDVLSIADGGATIVWYQNLTCSVQNLDTSTCLPSIQSAVDTANAGARIFAESARFLLESQVVFPDKGIDLSTDGTLLIPEGARWEVGDGSSLAPPVGERVFIAGAFVTPAESTVSIFADAILQVAPEIGWNGLLDVFGSLDLDQTPTFEPRPIGVALGARSVVALDLDADGDQDVLSASFTDDKIAWFENEGGISPTFAERVITGIPAVGQEGFADGVVAAVGADLDGDGDPDVVSASFNNDRIAWYENTGGPAPTFEKRSISTAIDGAFDVFVADLDGDSDADILSAGAIAGRIDWFANDGLSSPTFQLQTPVAVNFGGVRSVIAADLDGDGDRDVAGAAFNDGAIAWFKNLGGSPPSFIRVEPVIDDDAPGAYDVVASDVDGDGDTDLISAAATANTVAWYENDGNPTPTFQKHVLLSTAMSVRSVHASDIDEDLDIDILAASANDDTVWWFENRGGDPPEFVIHAISTSIDGAAAVCAADLDGDANPDILAAAFGNASDGVQWLRQEAHAPFSVGSTDAAAAGLRAADALTIKRGTLRLEGEGIASVLAESGGGVSVLPGRGAIEGNGTIRGEVESGGVVAPLDTGALGVDGDYTQSLTTPDLGPRSGSLRIALNDSGAVVQNSRLDVTGTATLAGTLIAIPSPGFDPPVGETFEILSASSVAARFDVAFLPTLPGRFLSVVYPDGSGRSGASVLLQVNALDTDFDFDPAPTAGAEGKPTDATLADLNLDGFIDLVMAVPNPTAPNQASGSVFVFYNDGNAGDAGWQGFSHVSVVQQIFTNIGIQPDAIAVGDLNGDNIPDLVIANRGIPGNASFDTITVLINEPGASGVVNGVINPFGISQSVVLGVEDEPRDVTLVDLDKDGLLDIAVVNAGRADSLMIFWNAGSDPSARGASPKWRGPDLHPKKIELPGPPLSIKPGDFDAGTLFSALAITSSTNSTVLIVQNNGGREFTLLPELPVGAQPVELAVTDLDRDGLPDIVTVNQAGSSVSILLNDASPGRAVAFKPSVELPVSTLASFPRSLALGDFDGDSDPDLAVVAKGDESAGQPTRIVKVFRNDLDVPGGQLAFAPVADQLAGEDPLIVLAGDVNGDGRDDLVAVSASTPTAARNSEPPDQIATFISTSHCRGDADRDGDTDLQDFSALVGHFGQSVPPGTNGDLDASGIVNVYDFNILAGGFGCEP